MEQANRIEILTARSRLLRQVRDFFYEHEFIEVQTPTLSRDTMVDETIDPITVELDGESETFFLQTSPEFAMKRLLLEGFERIFEITPAFRNAECGNMHNPEFTMLEWYQVGDDYEAGINFLKKFTIQVFQSADVHSVSYKQLFADQFSIDPHQTSLGALKEICAKQRIEMPVDVDVDGLLQILMSEKIEPKLGNDQPVIVYDWPATQSALAKRRRTSEGYEIAERFELYFKGIELANGYHELNDAAEQKKRMELNNQIRLMNGLPRLPETSLLLTEMQKNPLPASCGVAVGFDRLLMVKHKLQTLAQTMAFDIKKA